MSKKASLAGSGAALFCNVFLGLQKEVLVQGGNESDLELLGTDAGKPTIAKMATVVVNAGRVMRLTNELVKSWSTFFAEVFNLNVDFSKMVVPPSFSPDHHWLVGDCPELISYGELWKGIYAFEKKGNRPEPCSYYDLAKEIDSDKDELKSNTPYFIVVGNHQEATAGDPHLEGKSAEVIAEQKIATMNLRERLLLDVFLVWKYNIFLDKNDWTITSSRYRDGDVSSVVRCVQQLSVDECDVRVVNPFIRARAAASV